MLDKKMYVQENSVTLVTSASAIMNNLAIYHSPKRKGSYTIGVVHGGYVNIISVKDQSIKSKYLPCLEAGSKPKTVSSSISEVRWTIFGNQAHLIVTSSLGVHVYDDQGLNCLFYHPCCDLPRKNGHFCRGIAMIGDQLLCIGTNTGMIYIFCYPEDDTSKELEMVLLIKAHEKAITSLATNSKTLIAGNESGTISIWAINDTMSHIRTITSFKSATPCIITWEHYIIVGYSSGHVRLFDCPDGQLICEVAAHARCITAIDVVPAVCLMLTTSEDSFVNVWRIDRNSGLLEHIFTVNIEDRMIVGGQFLDKKGAAFGISCYDSNEVLCFKRVIE